MRPRKRRILKIGTHRSQRTGGAQELANLAEVLGNSLNKNQRQKVVKARKEKVDVDGSRQIMKSRAKTRAER